MESIVTMVVLTGALRLYFNRLVTAADNLVAMKKNVGVRW